MPEWNTISISGYHIREAGSTAVQELAFTFANAIAYIEAAIAAGLAVDCFAPRLSFFFNAHSDFLEEIAKFRAARRIYAHLMRDRFGAVRPALADAAFPRADGRLHADRAAARRQYRAHGGAGAGGGAGRRPVAAHQFARRGAGAAHGGVRAHRPAHPADHRLRNRRDPYRRTRWGAAKLSKPSPTPSRAACGNTCGRSMRKAGHCAPSRAATCRTRSRMRRTSYQRARGARRARGGGSQPLPAGRGAHPSRRSASIRRSKRAQVERLREVRASRSAAEVAHRLDAVAAAARGSDNLLPPILDAAAVYATVGEIAGRLRDVFGEYRES